MLRNGNFSTPFTISFTNASSSATLLAAAGSIAQADSQFMDLAKSTTTMSGRIRFNGILADVCYVYSLFATHNGSLKDAARYAKQCVTLNRRTWAALESRANARQMDDLKSGADTANGTSLDPLSSMRNEKGELLVVSNTHDALGGADFWFLVPALYRGLMQHSLVFANQGLLQEAIFVAEQAEKVASATQSPSLLTDNASWRAECWAQSGRPDKAETLLKSLEQYSTRKCLSAAGFHSAVARVHHFTGRYEEEIASYQLLEKLLNDLTSPVHIKYLDTVRTSIDALTEKISSISLDETDVKATKPVTSARGRKPAAVKTTTRTTSRSTTGTRAKAGASSVPKTGSKSQRQVATATTPETSNVADQCFTLVAYQAMVMHRVVLANLLQDDISKAADTIARIEQMQSGADQDVLHMWAKFKFMLAQSAKEIAEDFAFNTLPESTIAFPAIGIKDRRLSELPPAKRAVPASSATTKGGRGKKPTKADFTETLHTAREGLLEVHALAAARGSNHLFQQVSTALGHVTVLLSAVSGGELRGSLHPLYAAYTSEVPKCNALRLAQESVEADREQMTRDECLRWPMAEASNFSLVTASEFQKSYVDIIPESWIAMSLALNEARDELYITRYETGLAPFVLRLPLARHASRDMDEEEFSFEDGKASFDELIELSDFSTRTAKDMTSKQARQQWWAEREALDTRLHELLINMENIWLGGFKGVFSQHLRQPTLLARFRKTFENVLNNHLPSRRKKTQAKRAVLDTRVLELFIGLGDVANEDLDLDEELMDLIYFVVDILQFNGEPNAYDEIDFDAMVVETHDALRSYHEASHNSQSSSPHTILILDNNLHAFPWESMPCLEKLSISRLPSLAALRERLLAAKTPASQQDTAPGHYINAAHGGASILNPSGDLTNTLNTLEPYLGELQGPWDHISSRAPSEKEFENALRHKDLVLYFGHGSGAQFVRSKSVRRLYPGQQAEQDTKPGCATTFLFGCSSVHLTENGIYEPSGMLTSYLTAGAPAVLGMLWDVTDKDCDRFAIRAGELWGLWPESSEDKDATRGAKTPAKTPARTPAKTPAKKSRGKGKAAQVVEEGGERRRGLGLDEAVRDARSACFLRYLNGAAAVVYGIPVYLE
jgi:separase